MAYFGFTLAISCLFLSFLPDCHPIKPVVDVLFSSNVISSQDRLQKEGFKIVTKEHYSACVIATHACVPGYFFKLYTDDQPDIDEMEMLMHRINGALLAKEMIAAHGWEPYFKVPQKWLYRLSKKEGKQVILIAEDMDIYSKNSNLEKWASKKVTKEKLDILYAFLTEGGFADNIYPFNLPFSHDGRWALIDTEKYHAWPIPYDRLTKHLNYKNQVHWENLYAN